MDWHDEILNHQAAQRLNILKGFVEVNDELMKAKNRQAGEMHPNGKWVWKEYAPGKFDWRTATADDKKGGSGDASSQKTLGSQTNNSPKAQANKQDIANQNRNDVIAAAVKKVRSEQTKLEDALSSALWDRQSQIETVGHVSGHTDNKISKLQKKYVEITGKKYVLGQRDGNKKSPDKSSTSNQDKIKEAEKGAKASGGGYGPFVKMGKNSWKNPKTGTLVHDTELWNRLGGFSDFKISGGDKVVASAKSAIGDGKTKTSPLLKQSKLSSAEYSKAKTLAGFDAKDWKWNSSEDLYNRVDEKKDDPKKFYIKEWMANGDKDISHAMTESEAKAMEKKLKAEGREVEVQEDEDYKPSSKKTSAINWNKSGSPAWGQDFSTTIGKFNISFNSENLKLRAKIGGKNTFIGGSNNNGKFDSVEDVEKFLSDNKDQLENLKSLNDLIKIRNWK